MIAKPLRTPHWGAVTIPHFTNDVSGKLSNITHTQNHLLHSDAGRTTERVVFSTGSNINNILLRI